MFKRPAINLTVIKLATRWLSVIALGFYSGLSISDNSKHTPEDEKLLAVGKAYKQNTSTLLYTEKHFLTDSNAKLVVYYEPTGEEFARKTLDYSLNPTTPMFKQINQRSGESVEVSLVEQNTLSIAYQKTQDKPLNNSRIPLQRSLVVDAGFDNFINQYWHKLIAREALDFDYLLPTRGRTISLTISTTDCEKNFECFEIYPTNAALNLVVKNLKLQYHVKTKQLYTFKGRGNIADHRGKYRCAYLLYPLIRTSLVGPRALKCYVFYYYLLFSLAAPL